MKDNPFIGIWRIAEVCTRDQDADVEMEGFLNIQEDGYGDFRLGQVLGTMDYRIESFGGIERLEFTWDGEDEDDMEAFGRGWVGVKDGGLEGKIYFHLGEEFWFKAEKSK